MRRLGEGCALRVPRPAALPASLQQRARAREPDLRAALRSPRAPSQAPPLGGAPPPSGASPPPRTLAAPAARRRARARKLGQMIARTPHSAPDAADGRRAARARRPDHGGALTHLDRVLQQRGRHGVGCRSRTISLHAAGSPHTAPLGEHGGSHCAAAGRSARGTSAHRPEGARRERPSEASEDQKLRGAPKKRLTYVLSARIAGEPQPQSASTWQGVS
jgi:hypothetical protein